MLGCVAEMIGDSCGKEAGQLQHEMLYTATCPTLEYLQCDSKECDKGNENDADYEEDQDNDEVEYGKG